MYRNTDRSGLVCDGSGDGLTDPPCGIGRKLESLAVVKLLNCLDQAQVAFLDQVKEEHASADISFGNTDDQT